MSDKKKEIIEELAQTTFLVFGALCMFFSGYILTNNTGLSAILFLLGICALVIKIEYNQEEEEVVNNE